MVRARGHRWIGTSPPRRESERLLRGRGRYIDDLRLEPEPVIVHFVRCPHAHARIRAIDVGAARQAEGVIGVWTAHDLGPLCRELPVLGAKTGLEHAALPLARDVARFVGEPVVAIAARSRYQAEDAADRVAVTYEPLPAVTELTAAVAEGAPQVHEDRPGNLAARDYQRVGDPARVFAEAPRTIRLTLSVHRGSAQPMEPRGIVVRPEPGGRLTVWSSTQRPHSVRQVLAEMLGLAPDAIRVIAPDIGGGFGVKLYVYPEEVVTAWIALHLGRAAKWVEDRREHFLAAMHERDQVHQLEVAFNDEGRILALRDRFLHDAGAYTPYGAAVMYNALTHIPGPYRIEHLEIEARAVYTNLAPTGPYRGAGRPQGCYVMERVLDRVAHEVGRDPVEVRRKNLVRPEDMPFSTGIKTGRGAVQYDSGDYAAALDLVLARIDVEAVRRQQAMARREGRYLGLGVAVFNEAAGTPPFEGARVVLTPEGRFRVYTGATPQGQGHATTFAQICAEELGVDLDRVEVICGDTAGIERGIGTFGSRSVMLAGTATGLASRRLRQQLLALAGELLEAAPQDLEVVADGVAVKGAPTRSVTFAQLAAASAARGQDLDTVEYVEAANNAWTYGAQAVVVEVDPETGVTRILRSVFVHDCGPVVNPSSVDGQVIGGIAQGIGNALLERIRYDESGQLLTASFMDYLLPTALEVPSTEIVHLETPSPLTSYGFKGAGESGVMPVVPAVVQAIEDALGIALGTIQRVPLAPEDVRMLIAAEVASS